MRILYPGTRGGGVDLTNNIKKQQYPTSTNGLENKTGSRWSGIILHAPLYPSHEVEWPKLNGKEKNIF